jgi:cytidyltransferase-like protein
MKAVIVLAGFDNFGSPQIRLLQEASRLGPVTALVAPDEALARLAGKPPQFPLEERLYLLRALRYVSRVVPNPAGLSADVLPDLTQLHPAIWADNENPANEARRAFCRKHGLEYRIIPPDQLAGFPSYPRTNLDIGRKRVIVTGCYDWFHSGHVRFFEEVRTYGDLYVVVGNDANIQLLKGQGHPLLPAAERCYVTGSIRHVTQALISSGQGWLDAEPEIQRLKPHIYAVNEDGDRGGKREYCLAHGIEYLVLKRVPAPGLPARSSTDLRGF